MTRSSLKFRCWAICTALFLATRDDSASSTPCTGFPAGVTPSIRYSGMQPFLPLTAHASMHKERETSPAPDPRELYRIPHPVPRYRPIRGGTPDTSDRPPEGTFQFTSLTSV